MSDEPPFTGRTKDEFDEWAYRHNIDPSTEITLSAAQYDALAGDVLVHIVASRWSSCSPDPRCDRTRTRLVCSGIRIHRDPPEEDLHHAPALAQPGQPVGFTHEDVKALRAVRLSGMMDADEADRVHAVLASLASRIAALLPPSP